MRKINHLQGILSILSVALPTALIAHLPAQLCRLLLVVLNWAQDSDPIPPVLWAVKSAAHGTDQPASPQQQHIPSTW